MIKVGIVGGTGYTGVELLRLLAVQVRIDENGRVVTATLPAARGVSFARSQHSQF